MASSDLETHMRRQMVTMLVQRAIFCPNTGQVLDVRTCVVLVDTDGDPAYVLSQDGWRNLVAEGMEATLAEKGITVDPATVKEPK